MNQERRPGRPITFQTLYHQLPEIDREDPELVMDILMAGKRKLEEEGTPLELLPLIKRANWATWEPEFREELRKKEHNHLCLALCEPGFELLRWFPKYAKRLGLEMPDIGRLLDYVNPSILLGMDLYNWTGALRIIESIPQIRDDFKAKEEKPELHLLDFGDERGLVALIIDDESQFVIKNTITKAEEPIVKKVAGIVGPGIIASTPDWIAEEFLHQTSLEQCLEQPDVVGTALGIALRKTHDLGISYNDRFDREHVKINPQTYKVSLIDWSSAKEDGDIKKDIAKAIKQMKEWYKTQSADLKIALKAFAKNYRKQ